MGEVPSLFPSCIWELRHGEVTNSLLKHRGAAKTDVHVVWLHADLELVVPVPHNSSDQSGSAISQALGYNL